MEPTLPMRKSLSIDPQKGVFSSFHIRYINKGESAAREYVATSAVKGVKEEAKVGHGGGRDFWAYALGVVGEEAFLGWFEGVDGEECFVDEGVFCLVVLINKCLFSGELLFCVIHMKMFGNWGVREDK